MQKSEQNRSNYHTELGTLQQIFQSWNKIRPQYEFFPKSSSQRAEDTESAKNPPLLMNVM